MIINLEKVRKSERKKLERLLQLYLHDLSLYFPITFDSKKCEYEYDLCKYFEDNYAYFIKSEKEIMGFILVDDNLNNNYEISEMFVLNNYKGKKVGEEAVKKIFEIYKGNWTIKAVPLSPVAEAFWKKTVDNYTNGNYSLEHTGKYNRAELYFKNN
ncbi:MAG: GNAT family N-acetyltransferase [bacterium]|nr:GNAT family N-acetyltransferase [bacterium]